jgi:DNA-directed RNA polymerase specialized sigma24 family protein
MPDRGRSLDPDGVEGRRSGESPRPPAIGVGDPGALKGGDDPGDREAPTPLDLLFQGAAAGDERAFEAWLVQVEFSIRRSLFSFARAVDVESVVQETFLRMWEYARDPGKELHGRNASLRFALGMARNLARNEARRFEREALLPTGELPDIPVEPDPSPDPALARLIRLCLDRLPGRPRHALEARIEEGHRQDDRTLAGRLGMTLNTFLQNVVRGRRQLAACLEENGAPLDEVLP